MTRLRSIWASWSLYVYALAASFAVAIVAGAIFDLPYEAWRVLRLVMFPIALVAIWAIRHYRQENAETNAEELAAAQWEREHRR